jgi:hypothetical protein
MASICECGNEPSGSIKFGDFLDYLQEGSQLVSRFHPVIGHEGP